MVFRNTEVFMGRMTIGEQNVEKTVEFALANVTDIADLYGRIKSPRIWHPQGVSMRSILDCDFFAVDVVVHVESILRFGEGIDWVQENQGTVTGTGSHVDGLGIQLRTH